MRDILHPIVRRALEKDGWSITDDPYKLPFGGVTMLVDLGAENVIAATRQGERIAVEIKSFVGGSPINELHTALGQYLIYCEAISTHEPDRLIWLAVPQLTWNEFFQDVRIQALIAKFGMRIIVVDTETEEITSWIN
jgi:hypothetical protein